MSRKAKATKRTGYSAKVERCREPENGKPGRWFRYTVTGPHGVVMTGMREGSRMEVDGYAAAMVRKLEDIDNPRAFVINVRKHAA